ncbi:MAG: nitroreductase family protein [Halobacteriota archaeon]
MEKPADNMYPIHDLMKRRWSPRAFAKRPVEHGKLRSMFEAARWAPSAFNAQPWSFIVATKEDLNVYNRLLHCMPAANQRWARRAPVLLLSITNLCHPDTGKPDRFARYDLGLAVENLVLQATALGLFCHQTDGLNVEKARTEFNIPEGSEPVDVIAVGYVGNLDTLPDNLREQELGQRVRKPLKDFVFSGRWGKVSQLVTE